MFLNATRSDRSVHCFPLQGPKLRLTGHQCDQILSVGDQNFKTGRQQATNLLSPQHLKFQGKRAFLKENIKLPLTIVVKRSDNFTIATFTQHHIVSAASPNTDVYRGRKRGVATGEIVFVVFVLFRRRTDTLVSQNLGIERGPPYVLYTELNRIPA